MGNLKTNLIYIIFFLVYTQGFWERFTPIPAQPLLELTVMFLALVAWRPKLNKQTQFFILILFVGLLSSIYTETFISFLMQIRFVAYFYVIYDIIKEHKFSIYEFNRFLKFVVSLILLQGVASVYHIFLLGERVEGYVGFMSKLGGTTATSFTLLTSAVIAVLFIFAKNLNKKQAILLLMILASGILVGYSSGKRAIYFLVPSVFLISFLINWLYSKVRNISVGKLFIISLSLVLFFPVFILGIKNSKGFNYGLSGNESSIEVIRVAIDYAQTYESAQAGGATIGRSNTTSRVLENTMSSTSSFLFGVGFQSIKDDDFEKETGIGYGIVGITNQIISGGVPYAILITLFWIFLLFNIDKKDTYIYSFTRVMRLTLLSVFLIIHFTYSSDFIGGSLKMNALIVVLFVFLNSKNYSDIRCYYSKYLN